MKILKKFLFFIIRVVFRGEGEEEAVLCTKDKTFIVKQAQISNSLLIVAPEDDKENGIEEDLDEEKLIVIDNISTYLELQPSIPKTEKLFFLLNKNPYSYDSESMDNGSKQVYYFIIFFCDYYYLIPINNYSFIFSSIQKKI